MSRLHQRRRWVVSFAILRPFGPRCPAQAISILELSLKNACLRRDICEEDLDMVRDQIITVEVNIARVFNHDVVRRRQAKGEVEA